MTAKQPSRQNQDVKPSRQPFFRFFADDWIAGTVLLSYEEKGFFIDLLGAMWSRRGPIPYEQVPMALRCDPRMAKRLLGRLIEHGKVTLDASNRVYNAKLMGQLATACGVALSVEDQDDLSPDFYPEITPEIGEKLGNIFPENATKSTEPRARDRDHIHSHTKKEDKQQPASSLSGAARETEIVGLNGSTRDIVGGLAGWLNSDWEKAKGIVQAQVTAHGAEAVKIAYGELVGKAMGDNLLVDNPANAFPAFCREAAKRLPKPFDYQDAMARKARVEARLAELRRN